MQTYFLSTKKRISGAIEGTNMTSMRLSIPIFSYYGGHLYISKAFFQKKKLFSLYMILN